MDLPGVLGLFDIWAGHACGTKLGSAALYKTSCRLLYTTSAIVLWKSIRWQQDLPRAEKVLAEMIIDSGMQQKKIALRPI